ncbi:DivIVA domain-containing protein [Actinacidiphila oryziradicis]|uniref:Antigen 84 n=1 Tax=Actinacidiphila oryziradicis TaxID=2571141 RepID=A0A4U0RKL9_9ACTN|nr:DivIVA domain-containing protein [Actinacidiphila oryziradicis]TJZ96313.1 hypothetical protein FCI23_51015 [Actinacidiphila oryziradicis]
MDHQDPRDSHARDGGEARVVHVPRKAGCEQPWLTPEDVRGQVFTTVRLRESYDLGEVDSFMGWVDSVMSALVRAELREQRETAERIVKEADSAANSCRPPISLIHFVSSHGRWYSWSVHGGRMRNSNSLRGDISSLWPRIPWKGILPGLAPGLQLR